MYVKKVLDSYFFTTRGFYVFFIPIWVPYKHIYALADAAGMKKKEAHGPIIESGKMFGYGWIGVEVEKPDSSRSEIVHISGEFEILEHKGPYRTVGKAYKKIMKERPQAKEHYNFYLDNPVTTRAEDCRTQVCFR